MTNSPAILECRAVTKQFGGLRALHDVSFDVRDGSIVGLIGPNGAGKTTLFNCISGFLRPDGGEVLLEGAPLGHRTADQVARAGVVRTFQSVRMFPGLTVLESLLAAQYTRYGAGALSAVLRLPRHRREMREMRDAAMAALQLLGLAGLANAVCDAQPLLTQRKIELARAIVTRPRLLLLDEPSAGATPRESQELADVIRHLNSEGLSVLLIEHNVPFITGLADWVEVLHFGEIVASCNPAEVSHNPVVAEIYLGKSA
jgi:branched-chain amino acid transport system ATP-binding protein